MNITESGLKKLLSNKRKLAFRNSGEFKILFFSDFHSNYKNQDIRTYQAVERIIEDKQPDLVYLLGDLPGGPTNRRESVEMLSELTRPMDKRNIPWTIVFGNHDDSICRGMPMDKIEKLLERSCPGCLIKNAKGIHGFSNHVLPIYYSQGSDKIALNLFGLDAGRDISAMNLDGHLRGDIIEYLSATAPIKARRRFDIVRFDQVMWYWTVSEAIEKYCGRIPALMMTHSAPNEVKLFEEFREELGVVGELAEEIKVGAVNSALFTAALQRGDIIGFYFGHNHINVAEGSYCGMRMGYVGSIGYNAYGMKKPMSDREKNLLRGARMLTIHRDDILNYKSEFISANDYVAPVIEVY